MNDNFREKIKIENLAREILCTILENCFCPDYLTKYHQETRKYYDEFEKEFEDGLNKNQKEDFNTLLELNNAFSSTDLSYHVLYGIRIKDTLDELIKNPLKILELYDELFINAREQYKSVKQKMQETHNV